MGMLLFCVNIIYLAECECDLQEHIFIIELGGASGKSEANMARKNIFNVCPKGKPQSPFTFVYNNRPVPYCDSYKYLGVTLNCNLD